MIGHGSRPGDSGTEKANRRMEIPAVDLRAIGVICGTSGRADEKYDEKVTARIKARLRRAENDQILYKPVDI